MDKIVTDNNYADICRFWLIAGLKKPGKTQAGLWRAIGGHKGNRSLPNKWVRGDQPIKVEELPAVAAYIEEQIPPIPGAEKLQALSQVPRIITLEIEREIGVDTWLSEESRSNTNIETWQLVDTGSYRASQLRAYRFKGDSMDDIGIVDRDIILCVAYEETSATPLDGKLVVLERTTTTSTGPLVEVSLRIAKTFPDRVEFVTSSKNKVYPPIIVEKKNRVKNELNEKVRVAAVFINRTSGDIS